MRCARSSIPPGRKSWAVSNWRALPSRERTRLYTALYHSLLYPRIFSEYGQYYSAFDDQAHSGESYTAYSIWDTFRAENSLLTLFAPERIDGMITALLQNFQEGGWMPKWPNPSYTNIMIGAHADSLVAEAIRKGFHGFDRELAWKAVFKDAMVPPDGDTSRRWLDREEGTPYEARAGLTYYKQLGYIPTDKTDEAASRTLEDSYDDWCVAQIAKALGREDDYRFFLLRSLNDRNLFNPALGLMNGKTSDGRWAPIGGSQDTQENRSVAGWTEGDAWAYTFSPLHDQAGLIQLMGGRESYAAKLDAHFSGGHNVHSNEPSHHYAYLYDFAGQPWKTQAKVREIAAAEYGYDAGGLDGDDDCGQMSAWLLFTAMGFYPVNPASGEYMIGSPMHSRVSIRLQSGKTFRVVAEKVSARNFYIQSATLDGKPLNDPFITWEQIQSGATLKFRMGPKASRWGSRLAACPNSVEIAGLPQLALQNHRRNAPMFLISAQRIAVQQYQVGILSWSDAPRTVQPAQELGWPDRGCLQGFGWSQARRHQQRQLLMEADTRKRVRVRRIRAGQDLYSRALHGGYGLKLLIELAPAVGRILPPMHHFRHLHLPVLLNGLGHVLHARIVFELRLASIAVDCVARWLSDCLCPISPAA